MTLSLRSALLASTKKEIGEQKVLKTYKHQHKCVFLLVIITRFERHLERGVLFLLCESGSFNDISVNYPKCWFQVSLV